MKLGKQLLWGGLGWAMGGPIGAIIGFALATFSEGFQVPLPPNQSGQQRRTTYQRTGYPQTGQGDFMASLLILLAIVMKADGKKLRSELEYVKKFLSKQYGQQDAQRYLALFQQILKQDYSSRQVCIQIQQSMDHPSRLQIVHLLFGLSSADGHTTEREIDVIETIARYLNINQNDFKSIKAMFVKSAKSAYQILEVKSTASDDELKKAFRKMAKKYHPDKVSHLGVELQKQAEEKFKAVNKAYDDIKFERGIS